MRDDFLKDDFHLYVYNLETRETRQITFGLGVADIEPSWTPDGGDRLRFDAVRSEY